MSNNLQELKRLLHQQRQAHEAARMSPPEDLAPDALPNQGDKGFDKYDDYTPRPVNEDPMNVPLYGEDDNSRALRDHVAGNYDLDVMLEVALDSDNEELIHQTLDEYTSRVANAFLSDPRNKDYEPTDANLETIVAELNFQAFGHGDPLSDDIDEDVFKIAKAGYWTVEHITAAKEKLLKMGALETPAGRARSLTASELLVVQRTAVMDPVSAVCQYLAFASGVDPQAMTPPQLDQYAAQLLSDPKWKPVADDAALFAFASCPTTGYKQTPEHDAYIREYAGSRPLSFPLLAQAWKECQQAEHRGEMQRRAARPVTLEQIDALPDERVNELYQESLRERAKRLKKAAKGHESLDDSEVPSLLKKR